MPEDDITEEMTEALKMMKIPAITGDIQGIFRQGQIAALKAAREVCDTCGCRDVIEELEWRSKDQGDKL